MAGDELAVVIPTFRRPDMLERCLQGLERQTRPPDQIVVVVREGDDPSRTVADRHEMVEVVTVERAGQVAALQAGASATAASIIAFLDDDAVAQPPWASRLMAHFAGGPVAAVGGRDIVHTGEGVLVGEEPVVGTFNRWGKPIFNHHLGVGPPRPVQILKGCNCAYRREAFATPVGLRGSGAEPMNDLASSLRASISQTVIYDPDLLVDHFPAERHDDDGRTEKTREALLVTVHNQALAVLSLRPDLRRRYLAFYVLVGDALTPGIVRSLVASMRGERLARGRLLATQRTMFRAALEARRGPMHFDALPAGRS